MYDVNYFLDKFSKIPSYKWCKASITDDRGNHCALGHCGVEDGDVDALGNIDNEEAVALSNIFKPFSRYSNPFEIVFQVNDNYGKDAKENIISCLEKIRDKELSEANINAAKEIIEVEKIENNCEVRDGV